MDGWPEQAGGQPLAQLLGESRSPQGPVDTPMAASVLQRHCPSVSCKRAGLSGQPELRPWRVSTAWSCQTLQGALVEGMLDGFLLPPAPQSSSGPGLAAPWCWKGAGPMHRGPMAYIPLPSAAWTPNSPASCVCNLDPTLLAGTHLLLPGWEKHPSALAAKPPLAPGGRGQDPFRSLLQVNPDLVSCHLP